MVHICATISISTQTFDGCVQTSVAAEAPHHVAVQVAGWCLRVVALTQSLQDGS